MAKKEDTAKEYSVTELAERYEVKRRIVLGWIAGDKFPNARKVAPPVGKPYWLVPETDLKNFIKPTRRGRPLLDKPTEDALRKRQQRAAKKT